MDAHEQLDPTAAKARRAPRHRPDHAPTVARSVADPPIAEQASVINIRSLAGNAPTSRILGPDETAGCGILPI